MRFYINFAIKLLFALSTIPFLVSEKIYDKFDFRLNGNISDSLYSSPYALGKIDNPDIDEASGLVASLLHPSVLYTHNDSGGKPEVYRLDTLGQYQGTIRLEDARNVDWEDIAVGPGNNPDLHYIYVGDIGDNDSRRDKVRLYRFPEPAVLENKQEIKPEFFDLVYPDGPRDAETLMVDPWNGDVFILSKRDTSNALYRVTATELATAEGEVVMEKIMRLPVTLAVGGDISADGKQILIKNYWAVYYWQREEGESIPAALAKKPRQLPYRPEPQGEAIAFSANGDRYYTLSEHRFRITPVLYQYLRLN